MKKMVTSPWKDREHPCQTLKTMFCLQVCAIQPKPTSVCSHYILSMLLFMFTMYQGKDGQKRRRLESAGRENHSPKPSSSGRQIELQTKPDTPMVPSVRSRVQLLTQKRGGIQPVFTFKLFFFFFDQVCVTEKKLQTLMLFVPPWFSKLTLMNVC